MDKSQLPGALGWVASPSGSNQRLGSKDGSMRDSTKTGRTLKSPLKCSFLIPVPLPCTWESSEMLLKFGMG